MKLMTRKQLLESIVIGVAVGLAAAGLIKLIF